MFGDAVRAPALHDRIVRRTAPPASPERQPMKLKPHDVEQISATTLAHYNERAEEFWQGTRDHDVSQNIAALLRHIEATPPFAILDFGCGPGRDLQTFKQLGHVATGLEGAARFAAMARAYSGCDVLEQNFLQLDLPAAHYDGVYANAALFHLPGQELPRVLRELHAALKPGGVLFASNPRGNGQEGWSGDRYGAYHDLEAWRRYMHAAGFVELEHYYRPAGLPLDAQPWLASVWRKPAA
jgi:SAM-dependent methyltransferase